jgi:hypothetical protein
MNVMKIWTITMISTKSKLQWNTIKKLHHYDQLLLVWCMCDLAVLYSYIFITFMVFSPFAPKLNIWFLPITFSYIKVNYPPGAWTCVMPSACYCLHAWMTIFSIFFSSENVMCILGIFGFKSIHLLFYTCIHSMYRYI